LDLGMSDCFSGGSTGFGSGSGLGECPGSRLESVPRRVRDGVKGGFDSVNGG